MAQDTKIQWTDASSNITRPEGIATIANTADEAVEQHRRFLRAYDRWCAAVNEWKRNKCQGPIPSTNDPKFWGEPSDQ